MEDITWPRRDKKFIFILSIIQHEKRNFVSPSGLVIFILIYKNLTINSGVFGDFPKISDHFSKIFEDSPKFVRRLDERLRAFREAAWPNGLGRWV